MTMDEPNYSARSSIYVAPLRIEKTKRSTSNASRKSRSSRSRPRSGHSRNQSQGAHSHTSSHQQITPPPTPSTSQDSLSKSYPQIPAPQTFQPFLRAFFPFHPTFTANSSTVTLPLNAGDIILVHSIHTNGWADGTMLSSGARGWLPTNYCEGYDVDQIRLLLKSCLNLFDQFRGGSIEGTKASQIVVTDVVAGVRNLLETTECLTREAPNVKSNDGIRKTRKVLLTELSALVKAAKRLPQHSEYNVSEGAVEDVADEMILRAFKIVLRGVRFLDMWQDQHEQHESAVEDVLQTKNIEDQASLILADASATRSVASSIALHDSYISQFSSRDHQRPPSPECTGDKQNSRPLPSTPYSQTPRALSPCSRHDHQSNPNHDDQLQPVYALARLNTMHDLLLSYLGSYIGRLHHQARFTPQLQITQDKSVTAARELLAVVEAVYARDNRVIALASAKDAMYNRISALVVAAKEVVATRIEDADEEEDGGIMIPDEGKDLVEAATGCVRGAGECVAKTKFVIERIGDFELDFGSFGIGLGIAASSTASPTPSLCNEPVEVSAATKEELERQLMPPPPPPAPEKVLPPLPKQEDLVEEKPLPTIPDQAPLPAIPVQAPLTINTNVGNAAALALPSETVEGSPIATLASSRRSSIVSLPPLPDSSPILPPSTPDEYIVIESIRKRDTESKVVLQKAIRADSIGATSITATDSTGNSIRGSEFSMVSQTSTRATTPEPVSSTSIATPLLQIMDLTIGSQISFTSDNSACSTIHADDLTFNKDGQITGGTLPALVERLTVHDSTPDAVFVATFYLTFRLFATPKEFAEALVERFDSVAKHEHGATPVRLRVYNVFKGWLESHWRKNCDNEALEVITCFAGGKLKEVLPAAGKRLEALAEKVSSVDGPLVPRLVCGIGKTTTATTHYTLPETPIPSANVTRSQLSALRAVLSGGGPPPSILDFDPLELARQFTLKESRMFCSILPEELIAEEWTKKNGSLAVNVLAMSSLSTDLAHLVAETILDVADAKRRAVVIKHWIKVADRCLELNNYDSLMAIMCTMNTSTIVRLKKTWELVSHKTKMVLEHLRSVIDVSKNHAVLRARLRGHVPPCLPFLGTYLTDLTFINVGNPSKRPVSVDGSTKQLINFDKHIKTARIISELQRFQIPYRIAEVPEMQQWIDAEIDRVHNSKAADVQHLYRQSLLLEPRENRQSKPASAEPAHPALPPPLPPKEAGKFDLFSWTHSIRASAITE